MSPHPPTPPPELHPYFEPQILDEVWRLQQAYEAEQTLIAAGGAIEPPCPVERSPADVVHALDNLARCYQGLRDDVQGMQQILIRVLDVLAETTDDHGDDR
jgi:hypothetical protein